MLKYKFGIEHIKRSEKGREGPGKHTPLTEIGEEGGGGSTFCFTPLEQK